jgi:hypothetical protein
MLTRTYTALVNGRVCILTRPYEPNRAGVASFTARCNHRANEVPRKR